jgi:hypothetical protein
VYISAVSHTCHVHTPPPTEISSSSILSLQLGTALLRVIGFIVHRVVTSVGNCSLMGYYPSSSGNFLPTYRDKLSVPSEFVGQDSKTTPRTPEDGNRKLFSETSVRNFLCSLRNDPEERCFQVKVCFAVETFAASR